jgi:hypothetical protein
MYAERTLNKILEEYKFIKDEFYSFVDGEFDDKFTPEQITEGIRIGFLTNHLIFEEPRIIFEYSKWKITINAHDPDGMDPEKYHQMYMLTLMNQEQFKLALDSFLITYKRDKNITNILN